MKHLYVIYDERAILGSTDDALVLESCSSLREAKRSGWDGRRQPLGAVYKYNIVPTDGTDYLENEMFIGTVPQLKTGSQTESK